jgi:hypothetical protein
MRKFVVLSALGLLLIAVLAATVVACGGGSSTSSSTTASLAGSTTTAAGATTTAAAGETTTTVAGGTATTVAGDTTTTVAAETTTTEAARTTDTADHSSDFKAQYPSTESFDNTTWATLAANPASHLGAAVDVKGTSAKVTVDPDSKYLTWNFTVTGASGTVLCRTNLNVDRTLLAGGGTVEVKGIVVGAQAADAGGGPIIYVQSVQTAS